MMSSTETVCEVSFSSGVPKHRLSDLLRLSKASSLEETWPKARFRLVLVFCLPQYHVSHPVNELLMFLPLNCGRTSSATCWMRIRHESLLRYHCKYTFFSRYCVIRMVVCACCHTCTFATRSLCNAVRYEYDQLVLLLLTTNSMSRLALLEIRHSKLAHAATAQL